MYFYIRIGERLNLSGGQRRILKIAGNIHFSKSFVPVTNEAKSLDAKKICPDLNRHLRNISFYLIERRKGGIIRDYE